MKIDDTDVDMPNVTISRDGLIKRDRNNRTLELIIPEDNIYFKFLVYFANYGREINDIDSIILKRKIDNQNIKIKYKNNDKCFSSKTIP